MKDLARHAAEGLGDDRHVGVGADVTYGQLYILWGAFGPDRILGLHARDFLLQDLAHRDFAASETEWPIRMRARDDHFAVVHEGGRVYEDGVANATPRGARAATGDLERPLEGVTRHFLQRDRGQAVPLRTPIQAA
jgi:hypothetical protein